MKFLVVTNAPTLKEGHSYQAYTPYVREMDIWSANVSEFRIISPTQYNQKLLKSSFKKQPTVTSIPSLNFSTVVSASLSVLYLPIIVFRLFKAMFWADHIHLRCPGNIGLIGCFVQVFFPKKLKTAKYAGNWDPKAKQPLSYKLQKWILSHTVLTKNMTVLVYGDWPNQTKNIKSFFTATYRDEDRAQVDPKVYTRDLNFIFVGSLVAGKRPLLAIKIVEALIEKGAKATLALYGDGVLKPELQAYITKNKLESVIVLHGNQCSETVKSALKASHFTILASKSEGWPKALAEAMFFGVIPISTSISCVPNMLDNGNRGLLIQPNLKSAVMTIEIALSNTSRLEQMAILAWDWSQYYTLDLFEEEIQKLIKR
ncbi:glycosyltransferase [Olleya sp. Bg11-27]|uniref:glycosyltransferase n=1 Tax=Olleya sp. Bg11-27 TaxID=2058135 RepID=UPI000C30B3B9|nr:glycosyltransferase [Olleya sp. Bg11-27]AUC75832.1 glycosyl transferase [Olleya sp. Bg11-27]